MTSTGEAPKNTECLRVGTHEINSAPLWNISVDKLFSPFNMYVKLSKKELH